MLLVQASKDISQPGQAYKMKILEKIVNGLKFILRLIWSIYLCTWISDSSDTTDLNAKKKICFTPFNHLDHDPLDPG